jgi:hypothetical protein
VAWKVETFIIGLPAVRASEEFSNNEILPKVSIDEDEEEELSRLLYLVFLEDLVKGDTWDRTVLVEENLDCFFGTGLWMSRAKLCVNNFIWY